MSPFMLLLIAWGGITVVFILLVIYRSIVSMKEDDQLFLDPAESKMEEEQKQVQARLNRITPYTKGAGFASAGLLVAMAGMWVYQALVSFNR